MATELPLNQAPVNCDLYLLIPLVETGMDSRTSNATSGKPHGERKNMSDFLVDALLGIVHNR
jgi:hypothetical protein